MAAAVVASAVLAPIAASAQEADNAVGDLRDNDVTFEDDALSTSELAELDAMASRLQDGDGYVKVVVLADSVNPQQYDSTREYADDVRRGLGGRGSVIVFAPGQVGVASSVDSGGIQAAEQAAADKQNDGGSLAEATRAAAGQLGVQVRNGDDSSGGFPWFWLLLVVAFPLVLLWVMWRAARKMQQRAQKLSAEEIGTAETKVRASVDKVANDLLELADRADRPDAPPEARSAFSQGAQLFTTTQEQLEEADTRPELETAYEQVMTASWQMDVTRALLDGQPAPAKPPVDDLFPKPVWTSTSSTSSAPEIPGIPTPAPSPSPVPASAPAEPHYQKPDMSPWITAAAMAAMTMLSQRGMQVPQTRPPMDDGMFGNWASRLPSSPSAGSNRGFGRRRGSGPVVTSSGQRRERGMGRR